MQTTLRRAMLLGLAVIGAGCSTGDYYTGPVARSDTAGTMSANIATHFWTGALTVQATLVGGLLTISGTDNDEQRVQLALSGVSGTGTFSIAAGSTSFAILTTATSAVYTSNLAGGLGSVIITEFSSTHAKGTFSFTGMATPGTPATGLLNVTGGAFNVTLN